MPSWMSTSSIGERDRGLPLTALGSLVERLALKHDQGGGLLTLDPARDELLDRVLDRRQRDLELPGRTPSRRGGIVQLMGQARGEGSQGGQLLLLPDERLSGLSHRPDQADGGAPRR